MSRALQSLRPTTPKTCCCEVVDPDPAAELRADPDHEAELRLDVEPPAGPELGGRSVLAPVEPVETRCPHGRTTGVPLTTTVPPRPW